MTSESQHRPLRILEVTEPSGGGSGRHVIDLSRSLIERGHQVSAIYSPVRAEDRFIEELRTLPLRSIHAVPMTRSPSPADVRSWLAINRIIRAEGPFDIIHGHSSKAGALVRMRQPGRHIPRVYTPHAFRTMDPTLGEQGRRIFGGIESMFGKYLTDALICVSADEYEHARNDLGIPAEILHTIINGATPPPTGHRDAVRARLGVKPASFVFGFVGRLSQQKAPERMVEAFTRVAAELPCAELAMIGFGPQEAEIRSQMAASGFGDRMHLTSSVTGPEAMQAFDVLVMPSRYEAMSYVMLEAAASGLPMVLTDVGGASIVVANGRNGHIVANSDDVTELADAMRTVAGPDAYARMKLAAETARHLYTLEKMVDDTEALYRSLAA